MISAKFEYLKSYSYLRSVILGNHYVEKTNVSTDDECWAFCLADTKCHASSFNTSCHLFNSTYSLSDVKNQYSNNKKVTTFVKNKDCLLENPPIAAVNNYKLINHYWKSKNKTTIGECNCDCARDEKCVAYKFFEAICYLYDANVTVQLQNVSDNVYYAKRNWLIRNTKYDETRTLKIEDEKQDCWGRYLNNKMCSDLKLKSDSNKEMFYNNSENLCRKYNLNNESNDTIRNESKNKNDNNKFNKFLQEKEKSDNITYYLFGDGTCYEGNIKNERKAKKGILTFQNGNKYDGEWKDDKKDGKGVFTWPDGRKYDGEWKDDKMDGLFGL